MKAVVMAGGKGARLHPFTASLPKPLMPLGDMPVLEIVLRQLRAHGVEEVVLAVNHLHHLIRSFFGDGREIGLKIRYWVENEPLGTCGALNGFLETMPSSFLLMNGDILTNFNYRAFSEHHASVGAAATVATYRRSHRIDFGVLEVSQDNIIQNYVEKPEVSHLVSMGIYMLQRDAVASMLKEPGYKDMPQLLMDLVHARHLVSSFASDCFWLDIGNPDDYAQAQDIMITTPSRFLPNWSTRMAQDATGSVCEP